MRSMMRGKFIAALALTAVTVAVVGVVLLALTPIGCGPTNALGMKSISNRCAKPVAVNSPQLSPPTYTYPPTSAPYSPPASAPYSPPASAPYNPPASGPYPPYSGPASSGFPPYFPPASGSGAFVPPLSLNCRLPVYAGGPGSGGFIVFPGSTFVADPASAVSLPSGMPTPSPTGPGYGQNFFSLSYDRAYSKWLPVPPNWVSPDGSRYALQSSSAIWVQNVADNTHVLLGEGKQWTVVAFLAEGIYASASNSAGLWLLPLSGAPRQIATTGYWPAAAAGAAYGTATSAVPQGAPNSLLKLDLKTGATADWFARDNTQASVVGFDAQGHPLVQLNYQAPSGGRELWLATGPSTGVLLDGAHIFYGQPPSLSNNALGDSHGIWFQAYAQYPAPPAGNSGMVLYVPGSGIYWMSNISGQLAGGCN